MYSSVLSILPLLAQIVTAAPAQRQDAHRRDLMCIEVKASTIYLPTTIYINGASQPTPIPTITQVKGSEAQLAAAASPTATNKPVQPNKIIVTEGLRWGNKTRFGNSTANCTDHRGTGKMLDVGITANLPTKVKAGKAAKPTAPIAYIDTSKSVAPRNVLYFTNWGIYGANYQPQDVPADKVTHLLYAFGDMKDDGTVVSSDPYADVQKRYDGDALFKRASDAYGVVNQLYGMKKKNRNLKTLLSIGGYTYSQQGKFLKFAGSDQGRKTFASSAVKLLADWGLDGIDIDWEYPANAAEAKYFVELLKETRAALDDYAAANGQKYHYLLTVAASAGPDHYRLLDLKAMDQYVDAWHLMAYDYAGTWDTTTGHQANVNADPSNMASTKFNTDQVVGDYTRAGIAPSKLVLGLPLYGRSFGDTDGLGKPFQGAGDGAQQGSILYRDLPRSGATVQVDGRVGAAWSYDAKARQLVSFDNVASAKLKANYVKNKSLGGAVFWEASGDKKGDESLVDTMARSLGHLDETNNMLSYPQSQYDNIKNGASET
uniref:Endochitinase 1 n=1 Tax=Hypocrella siamensis TaxID=696354 RepID=A0A0P0BZ39_9HYPO